MSPLNTRIDGAVRQLHTKVDGAVNQLNTKVDGAVSQLSKKRDDLRDAFAAAKIWALFLYIALAAVNFRHHKVWGGFSVVTGHAVMDSAAGLDAMTERFDGKPRHSG